jgi:hypothetical protein
LTQYALFCGAWGLPAANPANPLNLLYNPLEIPNTYF